MRMPYTHQPITLRFKRWSRKGYAAFISIQRTVTIGQLSTSLAERFQKKNISLHNIISSISGICQEKTENEETTGSGCPEQEGDLCFSLLSVIQPIQMTQYLAHPYASSVALYTLYNNIRKARGVRTDASRLFFFQ